MIDTMPVASAQTTPTQPSVAGLDLGIERERDADNLAHVLAAKLSARQATNLTIATHSVEVDGLRHIALSLQAPGIEPDILWRLLSEALIATAHGVAVGLLVDDRYCRSP